MKSILRQTKEEERHLFARGENVTISSGREAVLCIPGIKSRFYIRGMKVFCEIEAKEHLYRNQKEIIEGEFTIYPGDVLTFKELEIEVWKEKIAVCGPAGSYTSSLPEQSQDPLPEGFPVYKRSPRLIKRLPSENIILELLQEEKQDRKGFVMSLLLPLGMMAVTLLTGVLLGRGIYLLMSVSVSGMTAILSGIRYAGEKKEIRERNKRRHISYMDYLWCRQKEIAAAYEREQEIYAFQYPCVDELDRMVREYDSRIYEKISSDEDFLTLSIGRYMGKTSFEIGGKEAAWDAKGDMLTGIVGEIRRKYSVIEKPKVIDLKNTHLGMVGEKDFLHRQIKILAVQAAFFQSYHDLQMVAVYDREYEDRFAWMRWLPHTRILPMNVSGLICSERTRDLVLGSISQILKERAERLKGEEKAAGYLPHYLFLVDEPSWITDHGIAEYLRMDGNALGFSIIYTSYIRSNLPEYIGTVLTLNSRSEGTLLIQAREYAGQKLIFDHAQDVDCEWFARNLCVLEHEQKVSGYIPKSVTFFQLYGIRRPEELEIRKRWSSSQSHKSLAVPLGLRSEKDVLFLNLHERADGPHGLAAGTTGSGKSELIQSYILSLAVNFHPNEVGFLLIDYKGGGMADLFQRLPHHLGTITNLDGSGSVRALVSVKAELSRRQKIFRDFGVNHLNGYMRLFKEGMAEEPLPHLFIICDEFAELKKEQPDFMKELISAARIGRSLGVHLILATQKPAGVIDEQIWSNSRFKLCLKVQNESDSREVLKTADAASITLPGRAYLKVGNHETYELFQSAFSGAAYREGTEKGAAGAAYREGTEKGAAGAVYREGTEKGAADDERVYVVNELGQGELVNQDLSGKTGEYLACRTQLEAVTDHIREVFGEECGTKARKPWLPPLKKMLVSPAAADLAEKAGGKNGGLPQAGGKGLSVAIGKIDIPEMQEQRELVQDFEKDGNLLFAASPGFGKTVFLTTVLIGLAIAYDVDYVNFYILDYGNYGCMPMKELPHTAEYISLDDEERYWKFKRLMAEEMRARKRAPEEYRKLVVAIDQFDVVKEMGIEEEEFFTKLTRDGAGLGIYTVAAATRVNSVRQATLNNFKNKIAGYQFDENEAFLMVGRGPYKQTDIKGRVLTGGEKVHEAQIYSMVSCEDKAVYSGALKELIHKIRRRSAGKEAPHIPVLPQEFISCMLGGYPDDGSDYLVGLELEKVTGKGFDKTAGVFAVIGNTGMGKTNILKVLADQAALKGRTCIFDSRDMELYYYRRDSRVLYVEGRQEKDLFLKEMEEELETRRQLMKKRLSERRTLSPKKLAGELPYYTVIVDDLDDFSEFMKEDLDRASLLIKEGTALGMVCIITVHAAKSRGVSRLDRMVKQAANGLVLSSQGVVPIFPVPSTRELPRFGDGLLFQNGVYQKVRLPKYHPQGKQP